MSTVIVELPNAFAPALHQQRALKGRAPRGVTRLNIYRREREREAEAQRRREEERQEREIERNLRMHKIAELIYRRCRRNGIPGTFADALARVQHAVDEMRSTRHDDPGGAA